MDFKHLSRRSLGPIRVSTSVFTTPQQQTRESSCIVYFSLVVEPTYDLLSFNAYRVDDHQVTSYTGYHNLGWQFREYLTATGQKTFTRRIPARAYAVANGKMQEILPELSSETMDVEDKRLKQLMGLVTDFQISRGSTLHSHRKRVLFYYAYCSPLYNRNREHERYRDHERGIE